MKRKLPALNVQIDDVKRQAEYFIASLAGLHDVQQVLELVLGHAPHVVHHLSFALRRNKRHYLVLKLVEETRLLRPAGLDLPALHQSHLPLFLRLFRQILHRRVAAHP